MMRLRHRSGRVVHLSHRTPAPAARDLPSVVEHLDTHASAIRARLGVDTLGVSPWLPPALAAALAVDARARTRLRAELDARGLEVVTLSGLPYTGGGGEDLPDWSDPARLEYTLDLARILVDLLPDDAVRGAVSTVGFGRRDAWDALQQKEATRILGRLSAGLAEVAWHTGRAVRVGFQPAPGRILDSTSDIIAALSRVDSDRIGVSLDLAALACTWQDPSTALDRLTGAGISIIGVRVAAALAVADPPAAAQALRRYVEPDHPHAVTTPAGVLVPDLADALGDFPPGPWRVHTPVPLHTTPDAPLTATTDVWRAAVRRLLGGPLPDTEYLEIESGAAAEIAYLGKELTTLGLTPPARARAA